MNLPDTGYLLFQHSNIHASFAESFQDLRTGGEFLDVTLACEDEAVEAHKVIISACSPFFRKALTKSKHPHPYIYLKGVHHQDLLSLIAYMYKGETSVSAENVNRFLEAARELQIKGLAPDENEKDEILLNQKNEDVIEINLPIKKKELLSSDDSDGDDVKSVKTLGNDVFKDEATDDVDDLVDNEILKKMETIKGDNGKKMWKCTECGRSDRSKSHIRSHVEKHLEGFSHKCEFCEKEFRTRNARNSHKYLTHTEKVKCEVELKESKIEPELDISNADLGQSFHNQENDDFLDSGSLNDLKSDNEMIERLMTEISKRLERHESETEGAMWRCKTCGKKGKRKDRIGLHIETHLEGFSHVCRFCDRSYKTRGSLQMHVSTTHRAVKEERNVN